jgi:hypothetical protein
MFVKNAVLYVSFLFLISSCSNKKDAHYDKYVTKLGKCIKIDPGHLPNSAMWMQRSMGTGRSGVPGPIDSYLIAILEYDQFTGKQFFDLLRKEKQVDGARPYFQDKEAESGYPASVSGCFKERFKNTRVYDGVCSPCSCTKGGFSNG